MKKITLVLCFFAFAAFGQTPLTLQEYVDAGLHNGETRVERAEGTMNAVRSTNAIIETFTDRVDYLANCLSGDLLTLEDFTGGPTTIGGCDDVISSLGGICYPAGELQDGFEVSTNTPGNGTIYVDPSDGFGTLDPVVGTNIFTDFTIINFTGVDPVTSVGFDVYSLTTGSNVDIRVIGENGLIDTIIADVSALGPVFVGLIADEPIVSIELEDLSGSNVELIAQLLFGSCTPLELNDDPITAINLPVGVLFEDFSRVDDNTEATASEVADPSIPDPTCSNYGGGDLWYRSTVPASGNITFETKSDDGSITDTGMSVYEGAIGSLVEVACNDDDGDGSFSFVDLDGRTPGEVLYVRVFEFNGNTFGTFQVAAYDTPPPANDDTNGAVALTVGAVFADFPETGTNVSATASEVLDATIMDPTCSTYGGGDVWFSVEVPSTGEVTIETDKVEGSSFIDSGMSIYEGSIGALVEIGCNDNDGNTVDFSLISLTGRTGGEILYIRIFEAGNDAIGEFQVAAYSDCAVNGGSISVTENGSTMVSICTGDDMADPINVTSAGTVFGTNMGWIITDNATGEILGLPAAPPFDLEGVAPGICDLWFVSYEDDLTGLVVGNNISDLVGCYDLSNPIMVDRVSEGAACEMCEYTLQLIDSFGDGWNGGTIDVLVDGSVVLDDATLADGSEGFLTFPVNSTADVSTQFGAPGDFAGEISYNIIDVNGNIVASGTADPATDIVPGTVEADCPSCLDPSDLIIGNITDSGADLSWTDNNDPVTPEFTVEWGPVGFVVGAGTIETVTTASLMLTGLDAGTEYEYYVTANCAVDDASNIVGPVAFATMAPPGDCSYTLEMNDSFGDGWNGALIDVFRNGLLALNDVSLDDDPNNDGLQGVLPFEILPGDDITTAFVDGGGFPGEVSYRILDANFIEVATGDVATDVETGTVTGDCPTCFAPFDLIAGNFAPGSVDLTWSMPMAAFGYNWEIQDVGVAQGDAAAIATGNTLVDTFDTALGAFIDGNSYTWYIQAGCTEDDFSIYVSIDFLYFLPPVNNDCENAIEVFCGDTVTGSTTNASDSGGSPGGDVFYTFATPETAQDVTVSLCDGGTTYDSRLRIFDDACALVSEIAENDDACGLQSEVMFTATEGMTYTIMVEGFGSSTGDFSMAVTCEPNLSVDSAEFSNFSFYPNPAQNRINLDAQQSIEQVTIFNMLGQKVLDQKVGVSNAQLDVSNLRTGNYIMRVIIDGQKGVYKVLKQ